MEDQLRALSPTLTPALALRLCLLALTGCEVEDNTPQATICDRLVDPCGRRSYSSPEACV